MTHDDENGALPDGWVTATLQHVTREVSSVDPRRNPSSGVAYIDISSIDNERLVVGDVKRLIGADAPSRARRPVEAGDILFSNVRTYLRNVARIDDHIGSAIASTGFTVLRPTPAVTTDFLFRYVASDQFLELVTPRQTGTHYPATSDRVVRQQQIPLPPIAEQKRIAERLDKIESRRAVVVAHLQSARGVLERVRKTIPAAACSGRLTADWRERNEPESPTTTLQAKRAADRARLGRKYVEPQVDTNALPEIPTDWCWALLPELGEMGRGKSRHRPRNDPRLYGGEYPFVQTGDVARANGRIVQHAQTYNDAGLAQSRLWPADTVCVTIAANIAESALLSYPACFPDSVVGLVADHRVALPEYVELFVRTARDDLAAFAPATAQANINLAILATVAVPLPSVEEQAEIVRRASAALATADRLAIQIEHAERALDRASRASLAKAFRGELVSTEAALAAEEGRDFESGEELLARIEKAAPAKPSRRRRTKV